MCLKPAGCVENGKDPDQMSHFVASDQGLHCLIRSANNESKNCWMSGKKSRSDEMPYSAASDLGLDCLLRPV